VATVPFIAAEEGSFTPVRTVELGTSHALNLAMSYRDELEAAHGRITSLETKNRSLSIEVQTGLAAPSLSKPKASESILGVTTIQQESSRPSLHQDEAGALLCLVDSLAEGEPTQLASSTIIEARSGMVRYQFALAKNNEGDLTLFSTAQTRKARNVSYGIAVVGAPIGMALAWAPLIQVPQFYELVLRLESTPAILALVSLGLPMIGALATARMWVRWRERRIERKFARLHFAWLGARELKPSRAAFNTQQLRPQLGTGEE